MHPLAVLSCLVVSLAVGAAAAPYLDLEKQFLYSFQDPDDFELLPTYNVRKRASLLNLVGPNRRFIEYRTMPSKKLSSDYFY